MRVGLLVDVGQPINDNLVAGAVRAKLTIGVKGIVLFQTVPRLDYPDHLWGVLHHLSDLLRGVKVDMERPPSGD